MPDLTHEDDQYIWRVQVKNKGFVCVDAIEVSDYIEPLGLPQDEKIPDDVAGKAIRECGWVEKPDGTAGTFDGMTDRELFAVLCKVMLKMDALGKGPGGSQSMPPPTDTSRGSLPLRQPA